MKVEFWKGGVHIYALHKGRHTEAAWAGIAAK